MLIGNTDLSPTRNDLDLQRGNFADPLLLLGTLVDSESDYTPVADGKIPNADDMDGLSDEDAIESFSWPLCQAAIRVKNATLNPAYLNLWIDADRDGIFNADEGVAYTVQPGTNGNVMVPLTSISGLKSGDNYYTRIRLSSIDNLSPTDFAIDGEVEDHWVNINPVVLTPTPLIVCQGDTASFTGVSEIGAAYSWRGPNGFVSDLQSPSIPNVQLVNAGVYTLTLTYASGCMISTDVTLTVTADNTVSLPSSSPALCVNSALTPILHTTTGATGIGVPAFLPAGVTAEWFEGQITISGTPTVSGTFNYSIPLTGGCGSLSAAGTIIVSADNTVSPPSESPTVCINSALKEITHTTTGATGIGIPISLPSGVAAVWSAGQITISGTPTVSGTFNYSIPLTGGCGSISAMGTITVAATPDLPIIGLILQPNCVTATGEVVLSGLPSGDWVLEAIPDTPGLKGLSGSAETTTVQGLASGKSYQFKVKNNLGCISALSPAVIINNVICANDDAPAAVDGIAGGSTASVLSNDTLDGAPFSASDVAVSSAGPLPAGLSLNADGTVSFGANTAPGTYSFEYTVCQRANSSICDTGLATVVVSTLVANDDAPAAVDGIAGGSTASVLSNDTLDGAPFSASDVAVSSAGPLPAGLSLNADGTVSVGPNTAPGTYSFEYTVCQRANVSICDTAKIYVIVEEASIEIIKKGTFNDLNGDGFAQNGETITYNFSLVNTGTVDLTNIVVTDPIVNVTGGPLGVLNAGRRDDSTFIASYLISQEDIDRGFINNQALVSASSSLGTTIFNLSDSNDPTLPGKNDSTVTKLPQNLGLKLLKQGMFEDTNHDGLASEGDCVNYTFRIINTGNIVIKNVLVSDPMVTVVGEPIPLLEPLTVDETTFTAKYILKKTDIERGAVYNLAMINGKDPDGRNIENYSESPSPLGPDDEFYEADCPSCTVTILEKKSSIALIKTAVFNDENNNEKAEAGETITYNFIVTNTGNDKLTDIFINDPLPGIVITGGPISLSPGESDTTSFKGLYVIKQIDINDSKVSNQAFVTGKNSIGLAVSDASDDSDNLGNNPTVLSIQGCVIEIFNAMSVNGDAINERFYIQGVECYPDNKVEIYNRWGVLVFDRENYNNEERAFKGLSEGRTTIRQSSALPVGTYYYIFKYKDSDSNAHQEAGYLYLTK